jgi:hypothetical protein
VGDNGYFAGGGGGSNEDNTDNSDEPAPEPAAIGEPPQTLNPELLLFFFISLVKFL